MGNRAIHKDIADLQHCASQAGLKLIANKNGSYSAADGVGRRTGMTLEGAAAYMKRRCSLAEQ